AGREWLDGPIRTGKAHRPAVGFSRERDRRARAVDGPGPAHGEASARRPDQQAVVQLSSVAPSPTCLEGTPVNLLERARPLTQGEPGVGPSRTRRMYA